MDPWIIKSNKPAVDFWDPLLINTLSQSRPILLFDNAGIGKSSGTIPTSLHGWATHLIDLITTLKIPQIDLLGFSMGGGAVQCATLAAPPGMIRKLIIAGSRTSANPTMVIGDRAIYRPLAESVTEEEFKESWIRSFYPHTDAGRAAGEEVWRRIQRRDQDRAPHLSVEEAKRQVQAFKNFSKMGDERNPYERLVKEGREMVFNLPVLVANGDDDLLIPSVNSVHLVKMLNNARLKIYEDSGHGFLFQYAERFAADVNAFLDGDLSAYTGYQEEARKVKGLGSKMTIKGKLA
jgi:pimeloyl-ACP methyl ester carboxylesterase